MRLVLTALTLAATAAPALAQPGTCSVTFLRAPDDVRHVIEKYLEAEPHCVASLELRIIPTEDGLYLIGQRDNGRIHERVVPDATAAAMIVASWVADDWTVEPPRAAAPPPAPAITPTPETTSIRAIAAPRATGSDHWLSLGPMLRAMDGGGTGMRAELEIVKLGRFVAGIAASASESHLGAVSASGAGYATATDLTLMGTLAYPLRSGRWTLRPALGLGAIHSELSGEVAGNMLDAQGEDFVAQAGVTASVWLGDRWALSGGPLATWIDQRLVNTVDNNTVGRATVDLMLYAGLGYKL